MDNDLALRFDCHCHTDLHTNASKEMISLAELKQVNMAKTKNLVGFALTNHTFDKKTFDRVTKLADPMIIVPGQEIQVDKEGTHILALGITKNIKDAPIDKVVAAIRKQGGIAIQSHPFRVKYAVSTFDQVDGAEVWNGSRVMPSRKNYAALAVAEDQGSEFIKLAGSDSHFMFGFSVPGRATTLLASQPLDWKDLITNIRKYAIGIKMADSLEDTQFWMAQDFEQAGYDPEAFQAE